MLNATLVHEIILAVIIGGLTGRLTDFGAVQLLFRPYRPWHLGPWKLHGVLPARQDALARQVANSIADRLLSAETLAVFISSPEMAAKIRENVQVEVDRLVDRDLPSIKDLLGELLTDPRALDEELRVLSNWFGEYLASLASSPEIRAKSSSLLAGLVVERRAMRVEELLAPGILEAIHRFMTSRVDAAFQQPAESAAAVDRWLSGMGHPGALLSETAQTTLRQEAKEKTPDWLKALEVALRQPDTQAWLDRYVLDTVEGFVEDLPRQGFLGELVGWFIRTTYRENKVFYRKKLLEILPGQVASFREGLQDAQERDKLNQKIDQAFDEILTIPLGDRYQTVPPELRRDLQGFIVQLLSSDSARSSVEQVFERLFTRFKTASLEEFLPTNLRTLSAGGMEASGATGPVRDVVDFGFDLLLESGLQGQLQGMMAQGASFLLSRPIGKLRDRLGADRLSKLHGTIETQVLAMAEREAPRLARLIDVRSLVETRIREANAPGIERIVKSLARKELNSIFTKGLYGGVLVSMVLTGSLLGLEYGVDRFWPGYGIGAVAIAGLGLMVLAARRLRIPDPPVH